MNTYYHSLIIPHFDYHNLFKIYKFGKNSMLVINADIYSSKMFM